MQQATKLSEIDNGPVNTWLTDDVKNEDGSGAKLFTDRYIIPYLKVAKYCGNSTTGDCRSYDTYTIKNPSPNTMNWLFASTHSKFYLQNGILVSFSYDPGNVRFMVNVDINGPAKPNIWGKDSFVFTYSPMRNNFGPDGRGSDRETNKSNSKWGCNKTASPSAGDTCAVLIQQDGWRIADDYPW